MHLLIEAMANGLSRFLMARCLLDRSIARLSVYLLVILHQIHALSGETDQYAGDTLTV